MAILLKVQHSIPSWPGWKAVGCLVTPLRSLECGQVHLATTITGRRVEVSVESNEEGVSRGWRFPAKSERCW